jgi:hypothetical protein
MNFLETLNEFKSQKASIQKLISLKSDNKLIQGIVAWQNTPVSYDTKEYTYDDSTNSKWKWLWECCIFDKQQWGVMSGIKVQEIEPLFNRLVGLKLIYPDGTIDDYTSMYIGSLVKKMIEGNNRQVGRPKKEKEE